MENRNEFLIVGYSFGSLIAIELARLLEAENFLGRLILIDGAPDALKHALKQLSNITSQDELENAVLIRFMTTYFGSNYDSCMVNLLIKICYIYSAFVFNRMFNYMK